MVVLTTLGMCRNKLLEEFFYCANKPEFHHENGLQYRENICNSIWAVFWLSRFLISA